MKLKITMKIMKYNDKFYIKNDKFSILNFSFIFIYKFTIQYYFILFQIF